VESWLRAGPSWTPVPTSRHREGLGALVTGTALRDNDVPDAHLAALAIEHGLRLATTDDGFARFEGLDRIDPLAG